MAITTSDVYYDPYDVSINADPYPVYRRLRDEAPLYWTRRPTSRAAAGSSS
jgi:hypothetical protein